MVDDEETAFVAWTTTPWTLPSNMMIAINPELEYESVLDEESKRTYIVAESRRKDFVKLAKLKKVKIVEKKKGKEYEGVQYVPLFDYFPEMREKGCFRVIAEDFVTASDGTGIVHCAPGFGEEDFKACAKRGVIDVGNPPCPVDDNGRLTKPITDFEGMYFKDADKPIKKDLKSRGRLLYEGVFKHSYPF